ncbi:MAG: hypothetical protein KDL09_00975, partial [Prosthecobacter sp.]
MKHILLALLILALPAFALERPKLQIINAAQNPLEVYWEMNDGHRVSNGTIAPGKDKIIGTTLGHRFVITEGVKNGVEKRVDVVSKVPVQGFRYDPAAKDGVPAFYTQVVRAHGYPICGSA